VKAVYFDRHGPLDVLRYGEVPMPTPGPGEVLLEIKAAALNFNDIWARRGLPRVRIPMPHISGTDAAGVVVGVGPDVTHVSVGQEVITYPVRACRRCAACQAGEEVFCKGMQIWGFQTGPLDGSYAEYAKVQAAQVWPKPAALSWPEAAAFTTSFLSAWRMLATRVKAGPGDNVLIWGASGGTGSAAIQITTLLGADAIAVTSSSDKADFCEKLGARQVIVPPTSHRQDPEGFGRYIIDQVKRLTRGRGVDIIFDHIGETTWPISMECLRWGGTLVICGATEGHQPRIDLRYLWNKQLSFLGSHIGTHGEWMRGVKLVEQGRLKPPVTRVFALSELIEAQGLMETRQVMGKVVVDVSAGN
jgi:crotonyl-CoA carboxylase/reductase